MIPMYREPEPQFWAVRDEAFRRDDLRARDPLSWRHEGKPLSVWFHELVRESGAPSLCAYCDGRIEETSPRTIDHFFPKAQVAPGLALEWTNLYPACTWCNGTHKGRRWSCHALRPDVDLLPRAGESVLDAFLRWFDFDSNSGRIFPNRDRDRTARARARISVWLFGLNEGRRPEARRHIYRHVRNAYHAGDEELVHDLAGRGPYRMVALLFLKAIRRSV